MANETIMLTQVNLATNTAKAYKVILEERADGWAVTGFNGRIGGTLNPQPKLVGASYEAAKKSFDDLVKKKIKDKYKPDGAADVEMAAGAGAEIREDHAHMVPMQPTELDAADLATLDPDDWMLQEKHDGEARPADVTSTGVLVTNKKGQTAVTRRDVEAQLLTLRQKVGEDLRFDSEDMGNDGLVIFDIRRGLGVSGGTSFVGRNMALSRLDEVIRANHLDMLRCDVAIPLRAFLEANGMEAAREALSEGVVLKRAHDVYNPGKANSVAKASSLKIKFTADATFRVAPARAADKRSVGIESYVSETGEWVAKGNVTIPANQPIPEVGQLIDVQYLYVVGPGGAPVQTVFKKVRNDVSFEECDVSRLKMKRGSAPALEADIDAPGM